MGGKLLIVTGPTYFSPRDEGSFFHWLQSISCVESVSGQLTDLHIRLKRPPSATDLRELIALLYRYQMDMKPLAALKTARNADWFAQNTEAYWHAPVFGKAKLSTEMRRIRKLAGQIKKGAAVAKRNGSTGRI
ncbi:hypothetical protein [Dongia sp.]|jgi:hypothetical protein|uniref:hypothetical protein n=1 Tax=Dongia sp. TaxID=1977262 RepID=UPI0035B1CAE4